MTGRLLAAGLAALLAACDDGVQERRETSSTRAVMRPSGLLPEGSVPRTRAAPAAVSPARGEDAYGAFCAPCHGTSGKGDGPVVQRGFPPPAPFDGLPPERLSSPRVVEVITGGYGRMRPMAEQVSASDAEAIAAYVVGLGRTP